MKNILRFLFLAFVILIFWCFLVWIGLHYMEIQDFLQGFINN